MSADELRQRCEAIVAQLDLPDPFDLDEFCSGLGTSRGKQLVLLPMSVPTPYLCGLWIGTPRGDYVFYEQGTTPAHRRHIVLHELGHILSGHRGSQTLNADLARLLAAGQQDGPINRVLARETYSDEQERAAELIATLLGEAIERGAPEPARPDDGSAVWRIERSLRAPRAPRRPRRRA